MLYSCDKGLIPPENSSIYSNGVKVAELLVPLHQVILSVL